MPPHAPASGIPAPSTEYAPRITSCCRPISPSGIIISTSCGRPVGTTASATSTPASRWRPAASRLSAADTVKPAPPNATIATPPVPAPPGVISPQVVVPTTTVPGPIRERTPSSSAGRSSSRDVVTITAAASRP